MIVPVPVVRGVPVAVVEIVDMVAVQDALMAAAVPVPVFVPLVGDMVARLALVPVAAVLAVQMPAVGVVDVVPVRHLGVSAVGAVGVRVGGVFLVEGAHVLTFGEAWVLPMTSDRLPRERRISGHPACVASGHPGGSVP